MKKFFAAFLENLVVVVGGLFYILLFALLVLAPIDLFVTGHPIWGGLVGIVFRAISDPV